jgi:replication factor C subunit 1
MTEERGTKKQKLDNDGNNLWVERYAPKNIGDIMGNTSSINSLKQWLTQYGNKKMKQPKAVLITGPPGIGKTTTARSVGLFLNREIIELNSADISSRAILLKILVPATSSKVISFKKEAIKKRLIIIDEVDCIASGSTSELIKIIKNSIVPIICICNDTSKESTRNLSKHCLFLKFQRPTYIEIRNRIKQILFEENLHFNDLDIENLIKTSGNDIRQVINSLQFWGSPCNSLLNVKDSQLRLNLFDATKAVFSSSSKSYGERTDVCFTDIGLIPLNVEQQYIDIVGCLREDELTKLKRLSTISDLICESDLLERNHSKDPTEKWGLLSKKAALTVGVGYLSKGSCGYAGFPEWIGKNSTANKNQRLLGEVTNKIKQNYNGRTLSKTQVRLDYIPTINRLFIDLLDKKKDVNGLIDFMVEYSFDRDDVFENLPVFQVPSSDDKYAKIESKVKSLFTRRYNKLHPKKTKEIETGNKEEENEEDKEENEEDKEETILFL